MGCTIQAAYWIPVQTAVVLKVFVKAELSGTQRARARREARMLQRVAETLQVPNVVAFYGYFESSTEIVLVMEHCEGGDLLDAVMNGGACLDERSMCQNMLPVLSALAMLHAHGIAHRDCKLENLFLRRNSAGSWEICLGDFGSAIHLQDQHLAGAVGTLEYSAPEVAALPHPDALARGEVNAEALPRVGTAVDIWSLGVCCYVLLCGGFPFCTRNRATIRAAILAGALLPLPGTLSALARDFVGLMLTHDPRRRPTAFMLAHHPFLRQHCTRREILAAASGPDHPFRHMYWALSPLPTFHLPPPLCRMQGAAVSGDPSDSPPFATDLLLAAGYNKRPPPQAVQAACARLRRSNSAPNLRVCGGARAGSRATTSAVRMASPGQRPEAQSSEQTALHGSGADARRQHGEPPGRSSAEGGLSDVDVSAAADGAATADSLVAQPHGLRDRYEAATRSESSTMDADSAVGCSTPMLATTE